MSYSFLYCPWPSYHPSICLYVLTILKFICRSLSLTSLRLYQSLASHSRKIASRWCTPRSRRGLSRPSHMCWDSWYLLWVRRWALVCCSYSSVYLAVRVFCISVCFVFLVSFGGMFSVSFFVLVLGLHGYLHKFYCIFSLTSNWKKGLCGSRLRREWELLFLLDPTE